MDKYYYLVSQLPMLQFNKDPGITIDWFLEEARKWLSARDYRLLDQVKLMKTSADRAESGFYQYYLQFEKDFRSALAQWRKSKKSEQEYKPSFPVNLVREGDPLDVEKKLLNYRWGFIEELEKGHDFDIEFLITYYLKLQILTHLRLFKKGKGMEVFQQLIKVRI